jgi:hypothetical protein
MNEELERFCKGSGRGLIEVYYSGICLEGEGVHEKSQNIQCPAEIRTEYLPNTSLERYS